MSGDPGSLANLRDLALPPEISFWPPAPGIWILCAGCIALLAIAIWRAVQRYRAAAFRRAAIAELDVIVNEPAPCDPAQVTRVSAILKRVAMVDYGRARVASLSGEAWTNFIASHANAGFDAPSIRKALGEAYAAERAPSPSELRELIGQASIWIRGGRKPPGAEV